ncbi:MAG: hypothetical protein H6867_09750 [Rhodospirillales bacterium]|nr:hypothetical protein [Rhodospirillales bacterium]MCB9995935.1 hypothetical protein [Rhodospirillales bacterium]
MKTRHSAAIAFVLAASTSFAADDIKPAKVDCTSKYGDLSLVLEQRDNGRYNLFYSADFNEYRLERLVLEDDMACRFDRRNGQLVAHCETPATPMTVLRRGGKQTMPVKGVLTITANSSFASDIGDTSLETWSDISYSRQPTDNRYVAEPLQVRATHTWTGKKHDLSFNHEVIGSVPECKMF